MSGEDRQPGRSPSRGEWSRLERLGRYPDAASAYRAALAITINDAERAFLEPRRQGAADR